MSTHAKFSAFNVTDLVYKTVADVPLKCSVLVPKTLPDPSITSLPVIVRWHGGSLVTGHRLYHRWFTDWTLALAQQKGAVILAPEHRFLPEADGHDIISDIASFWIWLYPSVLAPALPPGYTADLDGKLLCGESSGGWIGLQSLLCGLVAGKKIAGLVLQYPMLDLGDGHFCEDYEKGMYGGKMEAIPREVLEGHIAGLTGDEVVTESMPPVRVDLAISVLQQGKMRELLGEDRKFLPLETLGKGRVPMPKALWVYHGAEDDVVPKSGTEKFVAIMNEKYPGTEVLAQYIPGENHGFDVGRQEPLLDEGWIKEGLEFIGKFWPAK